MAESALSTWCAQVSVRMKMERIDAEAEEGLPRQRLSSREEFPALLGVPRKPDCLETADCPSD